MPEDGIGTSVVGSIRRCLQRCIGRSTPEPAHEVLELLAKLEFTPRQIRYLYDTFQRLKQFDSLALSTGDNEVSVESTFRLVAVKREWVDKILRLVFDLAGFNDTVSWDGYLFVLLQFCTLSKVELCQVLYFIISKGMKSWTVQYITSTQLEEFYEDYRECPVPAFNTGAIEFSKLAHAKYRMSDFIELMFRFSQLINPCLHLQRQLQAALPSTRFWSDYDRVKVHNRRIAIDFFRHKKVQSIVDAVGLANSNQEEAELLATHQLFLGEKTFDYRSPEDVREEIMGILAAIKRGNNVKGDTPLPYRALGLPVPYREKRPPPEILPAWLEEYMEANQELLAVKSEREAKEVAAAKEAQRLAVLRAGPKSLEGVRESIRGTYGPQANLKNAQPTNPFQHVPAKRSEGERMYEIKRHQELDFIRRNRRSEARRDNMVDILDRYRTCELIDRPVPKVQGHL